MAFKPSDHNPVTPDYKRLVGILNRSGIKSGDTPLFQVVKALIDWGQQSGEAFSSQISRLEQTVQASTGGSGGGTGSGAGNTEASYITLDDETSGLPNSIQLLAGLGITFDTSVANQLTINSSVATVGGYAPMSTGAEPLEIMSDGAGSVLMVGFSE